MLSDTSKQIYQDNLQTDEDLTDKLFEIYVDEKLFYLRTIQHCFFPSATTIQSQTNTLHIKHQKKLFQVIISKLLSFKTSVQEVSIAVIISREVFEPQVLVDKVGDDDMNYNKNHHSKVECKKGFAEETQ